MILRLWCAFVCLALLLPWSPAQSHDVSAEARTEFVEPIITEETLPNEPGEWDLRISCAYARDRADISADCLRTQLFFGIAPRWGLELENVLSNISGDRPEEARAKLGAALKYVLRKPSMHGPALVLALESGFAVGRPQASEEGRVELQPTFAFLQSLGRTTVQGNVGYAVTPGGIKTAQRAVYNLSLGVPWRQQRWHAFAEVTGSAGEGLPEIEFSPGLKYSFAGGQFLALGFPIGLNSSSPAIGALFQVQFALSKSRERGEKP